MTTKLMTVERVSTRLLEYLLYATAFLIPFLLSHPQLVVGSTVNALLFLAADRLPKKHLIPLAILPSLAVLARGVLFGPYTPFVTYFLPFIWLGNLALIFVFRNATMLPKAARWIIASALKALVLFGMAMIYVQLQWVPEPFLVAMSGIQFETALIGGLAAFGFMWLLDRK